jgi:cytochrome oxidase Cu insertion factor (SCO1/SenC/PrrC family)
LLLLALSFFSLPVVAGAADGDPRAIPLVDQRGATFRLMDLAGEPAVLTFVAARCTDACPIANAVFARMARQLRRDRFDARLVTVTLDPAHDTPAVMARLARSFAARTTAWRFASGRPADIRRLMDSLGVDVEPDAHGIPDSHTTFVYVLDRDVRLKRTLLLTAALARDVEDVLRKPAALSAR